MRTLSLGAVTFVADTNGVTLVLDGAGDRRVALSTRDAGRLEEFLRHNLPRERRVGFRVRIAPLANRTRGSFRAEVKTGGRLLSVRPVDFSLTGILVEARGFVARRGTEYPVHLRLDDLQCSLTGSVVRLEGDLVALHFLESIKNGELSPPEPLLAMYRTLETEWLRSRRTD